MSPHSVIAAVGSKLEGLMAVRGSLAGDLMQTSNAGAACAADVAPGCDSSYMSPEGRSSTRGAGCKLERKARAMQQSTRKVAVIGGTRIPFCRSNTLYAD